MGQWLGGIWEEYWEVMGAEAVGGVPTTKRICLVRVTQSGVVCKDGGGE